MLWQDSSERVQGCFRCGIHVSLQCGSLERLARCRTLPRKHYSVHSRTHGPNGTVRNHITKPNGTPRLAGLPIPCRGSHFTREARPIQHRAAPGVVHDAGGFLATTGRRERALAGAQEVAGCMRGAD